MATAHRDYRPTPGPFDFSRWFSSASTWMIRSSWWIVAVSAVTSAVSAVTFLDVLYHSNKRRRSTPTVYGTVGPSVPSKSVGGK